MITRLFRVPCPQVSLSRRPPKIPSHPRSLLTPDSQTFLYLMSLRTGASLSTLVLLLNKISGLYGILALATGLPISPLQLSMYIHSLLVFALVAKLAPGIRTQTPFSNLVLAWTFVADTLVNTAYTAVFAGTWFLVVASHPDAGEKPGGKMVQDTAGFTNPQFNVSHVEVAPATPGSAEAVIAADSAPGAASSVANSTTGALLQAESIPSLTVIGLLWIARIYLCLIVLAYARFCIRQHISRSPRLSIPPAPPASANTMVYADNPFSEGLEEGQGWKGVVGRSLVRVGRGYWLGREGGEEWMGEVPRVVVKEEGVQLRPMDRERRPRRSGIEATGGTSGRSSGEAAHFLRVNDAK